MFWANFVKNLLFFNVKQQDDCIDEFIRLSLHILFHIFSISFLEDRIIFIYTAMFDLFNVFIALIFKWFSIAYPISFWMLRFIPHMYFSALKFITFYFSYFINHPWVEYFFLTINKLYFPLICTFLKSFKIFDPIDYELFLILS